MDSNPFNDHLLPPGHPALGVDFARLQFPQGLQALVPEHAAKDGILPVQMRGGGIADEELTPVRVVDALIGHADDSTRMMAQRGPDLVGEGTGPDGGARFGRPGGRRPGLDHEGWDGPVEGGVVVEGGGAEREEVLVLIRANGVS